MSLIKAAGFYTHAGYSVIPTGSNKRSLLPWAQWQKSLPPDEELAREFAHHNATGLAVVCGKVSGNLEVIDVDTKYDLNGDLFERFIALIPSDLLTKLYIVKTKSGGYHLYYRCPVIEGNKKLAMRPPTEHEIKDSPTLKFVVLIETRGEGGYVVAPPTSGYEKQTDFVVPTITAQEREIIITAARSLNEYYIEDKGRAPRTAPNEYQKTPWDDYNSRGDVIALLEKHGWTFVERKGDRSYMKRPPFPPTDSKSSGDYHHGMNLFKSFSSNTPFDTERAYKPYAVYAILEHNGDFSAAAKQLLKDGYGERPRKSLGVSANGTLHIPVTDESILTFWDVNEKGKINILRAKLMDFLYDSGFFMYFYDQKTKDYQFAREHNGLLEIATTETMKKFIQEYIQSLPDLFDGIDRDSLNESFMRGADTYIGKGMLEFMRVKRLDVLRDTAEASYIPFRNGIVKTTVEGSTLISYAEAGKAVWATQIINHEISLIDPDNFDPNNAEFYGFIRRISGDDDEYLCSLIGYLLHRYKDPAKPYAVILGEETEDEKKGGGTGKGILVRALAEMANTVRVDGKNFKLDKSFVFQRVGLDTKILAIEDVRKNVDFEGFYSIITEGITVEKKNKDEVHIPYVDSPKIIFTTNYTVNARGGHGKRRQRTFEFSNYFSTARTPEDEFGHKLFDDWDRDEWSRFHNFMFMCLQQYLIHGIPANVMSVATARKGVRGAFGNEFVEWYDDLEKDEWFVFGDKYNEFLSQNQYDKKDYSSKRFKAALETMSEAVGEVYETRREGTQRVTQFRINRVKTDKIASEE
jgi:hypothetical protein